MSLAILAFERISFPRHPNTPLFPLQNILGQALPNGFNCILFIFLECFCFSFCLVCGVYCFLGRRARRCLSGGNSGAGQEQNFNCFFPNSLTDPASYCYCNTYNSLLSLEFSHRFCVIIIIISLNPRFLVFSRISEELTGSQCICAILIRNTFFLVVAFALNSLMKRTR